MSRKRKAVVVILLLIAAIALGFVAYKVTTNILNKKYYKDLKEEVFTTEVTTTTTVTESQETKVTDISEETEATEETKELFVSPIDFVELQKINKDIYAWIDIPDTDISYPVLQHPDEFEYYLRKGLDEEYANDGSLFTEPGNARDMSDFNTIIYGHNLRSLGMFGTLKYYRDLSYLEEHREIIIYTPYATFTYKVFAAVTYNDKLITALFDFDQEDGRIAFMDSLDDINDMNSYILDDVTIDVNSDRILTLSTCNSDKSQRFLVLAVLVDVEE